MFNIGGQDERIKRDQKAPKVGMISSREHAGQRRSNQECPSVGESTFNSDIDFPDYCQDNCIAFASGGKDPEFATSAVSTKI